MNYSQKLNQIADARNSNVVMGDNNAYGIKLSERSLLNKFILTGNFAATFYASDTVNIERLVQLVTDMDRNGDRDYIVKAAIYGADNGKRRDVLAFLTTYLICTCKTDQDRELATKVFNKVVTDGKMLSHVFAMLRSNITGVKSMGRFRRKLFSEWFNKASDGRLMKASVGNNPSLTDVIKLARPVFTGENLNRQDLVNHLLGIGEVKELPHLWHQLHKVKSQVAGSKNEIFYDDVSVQGLPWIIMKDCYLTKRQMRCLILVSMTDVEIISNIATLMRRCVDYKDDASEWIIERLNALKTTPARLDRYLERAELYRIYQALVTLKKDIDIPISVIKALQSLFDDAVLASAPKIQGKTLVALDISSSMSNKVNPKTDVEYIAIAAIFAIALSHSNPQAQLILFNSDLYLLDLQKELLDRSPFKIIEALVAHANGGTNCTLPFIWATQTNEEFDQIIVLSDDESHHAKIGWGREALNQFKHYSDYVAKLNLPNCKLICLDMSPKPTTSVLQTTNVSRIGGYGKFVFDLIEEILDPECVDIDKFLEQKILNVNLNM